MTEIARGIALEPNRAVEKKNLWKITDQISCGFAVQFHIVQQVKIWDFEKNKNPPTLAKKMIKKKEKTQVINSRNKKDI